MRGQVNPGQVAILSQGRLVPLDQNICGQSQLIHDLSRKGIIFYMTIIFFSLMDYFFEKIFYISLSFCVMFVILNI